ncbi:hypothetical protein DFH07DRAFT_820333 [Mycena maculata]|uniref:Uncharacterized protein n=1 Tax=Mycena maculata TaxID=230809 RepID=A0AAD7J4P7_9AGAR|nr:hypothetical protein DFH07DRAFT_820333 [Mycena maculata]
MTTSLSSLRGGGSTSSLTSGMGTSTTSALGSNFRSTGSVFTSWRSLFTPSSGLSHLRPASTLTLGGGVLVRGLVGVALLCGTSFSSSMMRPGSSSSPSSLTLSVSTLTRRGDLDRGGDLRGVRGRDGGSLPVTRLCGEGMRLVPQESGGLRLRLRRGVRGLRGEGRRRGGERERRGMNLRSELRSSQRGSGLYRSNGRSLSLKSKCGGGGRSRRSRSKVCGGERSLLSGSRGHPRSRSRGMSRSLRRGKGRGWSL